MLALAIFFTHLHIFHTFRNFQKLVITAILGFLPQIIKHFLKKFLKKKKKKIKSNKTSKYKILELKQERKIDDKNFRDVHRIIFDIKDLFEKKKISQKNCNLT